MSWNIIVRRAGLAAAAVVTMSVGTSALAAGDLLVAPTRIVLDGQRGAEVVLSNIGAEPAVYRVSVELRRMLANGDLAEVDPANATPQERAMLDMAVVTPRRVRLEPNQPQTVRVGLRPPPELANGEYRAHLLFRAVPSDAPAAPTPAPTDASAPAAPTAADNSRGVSIALRPIYGITIPLIVRRGPLDAQATIANARLERIGQQPTFRVELGRTGSRSVFGDITVSRPGAATPIMQFRGLSVYTEVAQRNVTIPLTSEQESALRGPVVVRYIADGDSGGVTLAETTATLR